MTDVNWAYSDHFAMYKNIKSLYYTSETKIIYVKYNLIKKIKAIWLNFYKRTPKTSEQFSFSALMAPSSHHGRDAQRNGRESCFNGGEHQKAICHA